MGISQQGVWLCTICGGIQDLLTSDTCCRVWISKICCPKHSTQRLWMTSNQEREIPFLTLKRYHTDLGDPNFRICAAGCSRCQMSASGSLGDPREQRSWIQTSGSVGPNFHSKRLNTWCRQGGQVSLRFYQFL